VSDCLRDSIPVHVTMQAEYIACCLSCVLCVANTWCCRQSTATLCTVHTVVLRSMLTVQAQAWARCLLQLCKTRCSAGEGEAQQAAAGPPRALPLSVGAAAEDGLPEQPLRAPSGALRLPVHLTRLQPLLLLPRQVLQVTVSCTHMQCGSTWDMWRPRVLCLNKVKALVDRLHRLRIASFAGTGACCLKCPECFGPGAPTEPCKGLASACPLNATNVSDPCVKMCHTLTLLVQMLHVPGTRAC
jgi:hypothetical protein